MLYRVDILLTANCDAGRKGEWFTVDYYAFRTIADVAVRVFNFKGFKVRVEEEYLQ